jgi:hypothetical protein
MSGAFAAALGIDDSDRDFSAAIRSANLVDAVLMATNRFAILGAPPQTVQAALRAYLVRHLTATRCTDNVEGLSDNAITTFNTAVIRQTAVPPLTVEETTASKLEGTAEMQQSSDQSEYEEIWRSLVALSKGPASPDRDDVLSRILAWKGVEGQDPVGVFHQKVGLFFQTMGPNIRMVLTEGFNGPTRYQTVAAGLIATLSDPAILNLAPSDWLTEFRKVEQRVTIQANSKVAGQILHEDVFPPDIAQAMMAANLSALQVYGKLAVLEHSPPARLTAPARK